MVVTPADIRNSLATLRNTDVAPMGAMNTDVIAGLLVMLLQNGGTGGSSGGSIAGSVSIQDGSSSTQKLAINNSGQASVVVANFPATQPVSLTTLPALAAGSNAIGSVSVSNFPALQTVSLASNTDAAPVIETALTAVGSTTPRSVSGYRYYSYQAVVSGIGTNVVLRMEGTHLASPGSATDWYSLQGNNVDTTVTSNGSYKFQIAGETDLQVRMTLVSFSGGTPSVTCTLIRGN